MVCLRGLDGDPETKYLLPEVHDQEVTAKDIASVFGLKPRAASLLGRRWVESGFLTMSNPSKRSRRYRLAAEYEAVIDEGAL